MSQRRKAFHFDLDVNLLKTHYPSHSPNGWKSAWSDIRAFMLRNGFEHAQYSGYESVYPMSYSRAYEVLRNLSETYPWFRVCAQVASLTEIGKQHDVLQALARSEHSVKPAPAQELERDDSVTLSDVSQAMRAAAKALDGSAAHEPSVKDEQTR